VGQICIHHDCCEDDMSDAYDSYYNQLSIGRNLLGTWGGRGSFRLCSCGDPFLSFLLVILLAQVFEQVIGEDLSIRVPDLLWFDLCTAAAYSTSLSGTNKILPAFKFARAVRFLQVTCSYQHMRNHDAHAA
jgi:hypothetical protein